MNVSLNTNYNVHFGINNFKPKNILSKDELKKLNEYKALYNYSESKSLQWKAKRALDFGLSVIGSIVAAPIMLLSALAIKLSSKGPVLFKQERIGKDGNTFLIYKFRTMKKNASTNSNVQKYDDERITKIGRIMRKYSLDELPQFFNIIKGDMSLAGPRPIPLRDHAVRKQNEDFVIRYLFKPGASLEYKEPVEHFVDYNPELCNLSEKEYIQHWNLKRDIKTYFKTLAKMIKGNNY